MADHKLVLFPVDAAAAAPSPDELRSALAGAGFLGDPVQVFGDTHYGQGRRFATLVRFHRPHVAVVLGPNLQEQARVDSSTLCTIAFDGPTAEIRFLGGGNVEVPVCRTCRRPIEDWAELVSDWYSAPDAHSWSCPGSRATQKLWHLDWARTNGFGRFSIELWHVHPDQATPAPELLRLLCSCTGTTWDYFYYRL